MKTPNSKKYFFTFLSVMSQIFVLPFDSHLGICVPAQSTIGISFCLLLEFINQSVGLKLVLNCIYCKKKKKIFHLDHKNEITTHLFFFK